MKIKGSATHLARKSVFLIGMILLCVQDSSTSRLKPRRSRSLADESRYAVQMAGGKIEILDSKNAVIRFFIFLEDGWDVFDFGPEQQLSVSKITFQQLPDCFRLSGDVEMVSTATVDKKYSEHEEARYSGLVELVQKLEICGGNLDFEGVVVCGNFYFHAHRQNPPNSVPFTIPFIAFCESRTAGIRVWDRRSPKAVQW